MKISWSEKAEEDLKSCLFWSGERFGRAAARRYYQLVMVAISEISADPQLAGSRSLGDSDPGLRLYSIRYSRFRAPLEGVIVKKPRHMVVYYVKAMDRLRIVRLLHETSDLENPDLLED